MFIEEKITIEFNQGEKEAFEKLFKIREEFDKNNLCHNKLACSSCPLSGLCSFDTVEEIEESLGVYVNGY